MHSVVIGPGLGRDDRLLKVVRVCKKFLSYIHFMLFITFSCFSENFASSAVYCNRIHRQGNQRFFCNLCKASSSLHTVCLYQLGLVSDGRGQSVFFCCVWVWPAYTLAYLSRTNTLVYCFSVLKQIRFSLMLCNCKVNSQLLLTCDLWLSYSSTIQIHIYLLTTTCTIICLPCEQTDWWCR